MISPLRQAEMLERAQGCLLGQLPETLLAAGRISCSGLLWRKHPNGVRELADGGTWNTIAGQTDG
jgi:hypothetical protein